MTAGKKVAIGARSGIEHLPENHIKSPFTTKYIDNTEYMRLLSMATKPRSREAGDKDG